MMSEQSLTHLYSQEEVQQILNIALAQHSTPGTELSYSQLLEIAEELQILPETLKPDCLTEVVESQSE